MSRVNSADGQELVFEDINKISSLMQQEMYDRVIKELLQRQVDGFFDDSFKVNFIASNTVSVNLGLGFQEDLTVDPEEPTLRPIFQSATVNSITTPPDPTNDRIDIVVVKHNLIDGNTDIRKFKPVVGAVTTQTFVIDKDWSTDTQIIAGTPSGSPAVPATPAGFISIAELLVSAVSGMAGAGAITDKRKILPVGGNATANTVGAIRLTAGTSISINQLMGEIDAFLVTGLQTFTDYIDQVSDPVAPAVNRIRIYNKGNLLFFRNNGGIVTPVGSAAGGGGGANWLGDALEEIEFDELVKEFAISDSQKESLYLKVPQGYLAGRQIFMFLAFYSPDTADEIKMQITTSLIRKGVDAVNSTTNQLVNDTGDLTLTAPANEYREGVFDLTTAIGEINAIAVSAGDLLRVELERIAPGGTEATGDVRFIPSSTEVKFG